MTEEEYKKDLQKLNKLIEKEYGNLYPNLEKISELEKQAASLIRKRTKETVGKQKKEMEKRTKQADQLLKEAGQDWTIEWPKEPGFYLFYGKVIGSKKVGFALIEAIETKLAKPPPNNIGLILVGNGMFYYKTEQVGVWKAVDVKEPDLKSLLGDDYDKHKSW